MCQFDADAIALFEKATRNVNVFRNAFLVTLSDLAARHHALVTPSDLAAMQAVQGRRQVAVLAAVSGATPHESGANARSKKAASLFCAPLLSPLLSLWLALSLVLSPLSVSLSDVPTTVAGTT